jgi:hypothetical protein
MLKEGRTVLNKTVWLLSDVKNSNCLFADFPDPHLKVILVLNELFSGFKLRQDFRFLSEILLRAF